MSIVRNDVLRPRPCDMLNSGTVYFWGKAFASKRAFPLGEEVFVEGFWGNGVLRTREVCPGVGGMQEYLEERERGLGE